MTLGSFCPGGSRFKEPVPEYFSCPKCGEDVEVWSHEMKGQCLKCSTWVFRDRAPACIDWCRFADKCFPAETLKRLKSNPTA